MRLATFIVFFVMAGMACADGTVSGTVTGEVSHMPWRKGKQALGWASIRAWKDGHIVSVGRTLTDGTYELTLDQGTYDIEVLRPGFRAMRQPTNVADEAQINLAFRLEPDPDFGMIVEPRGGMSVYTIPGGVFRFSCRSDAPVSRWDVSVQTEYTRFPVVVEKAQSPMEGAAPNLSGTVTSISACLPGDVPPDLYRLCVSYTDSKGNHHVSEQPGAVLVLAQYPQHVRMLMHGDWHFNWVVSRPSPRGEVHADYFRAAALLGAQIVSLGDDVGFEGDDHVALFWHMLRHDCRSPVFMAFGNHDFNLTPEGHTFYFGAPVQRRTMGPNCQIVTSRDFYQGDWFMPEAQAMAVRQALSDAAEKDKTRLIFFSGHQSRWKPRGLHFEWPEPLKQFSRMQRVRGASSKPFEKLLLDSFTAHSMHGWAGLHYTTRIVDVDLGKKCVNVSPEIILPHVTYQPDNNGCHRTVTATIAARGATTPPEKYEGVAAGFTQPPTKDQMIPYADLTNLSLRFIMPRGNYVCDGGNILRQVTCKAVTVVYVTTDLERDECTVVVHEK